MGENNLKMKEIKNYHESF